MGRKTIVIGCVDSAVGLKESIKQLLKEKGYDFEDIGVDSSDDHLIFPVIAKKACEIIIKSNYEKLGILICGTGVAMSVTANKFPGIYAAVCNDVFSAEASKLGLNANVLCMGSGVVGPEHAKKITNEWLSLEFVNKDSPKIKALYEIDAATRKS